MDMDYSDYDENDHENGHRPQSRASQHSPRSADNNGYSDQQRRNHRHGTQQEPSYAYQQGQFDEPDRDEDDDMW